MLKKLYAGLCVVGFAVPYGLLTLFVMEHGLDSLGRSIQALFVNGAAAMLTADLLISSLVFWVWLFYEGGRLGMKHLWAYVAANLLVGLSLALPLFLYYRAAALEGRT
jgi:hypothetical protein